jgi:hypothetical protein
MEGQTGDVAQGHLLQRPHHGGRRENGKYAAVRVPVCTTMIKVVDDFVFILRVRSRHGIVSYTLNCLALTRLPSSFYEDETLSFFLPSISLLSSICLHLSHSLPLSPPCVHSPSLPVTSSCS